MFFRSLAFLVTTMQQHHEYDLRKCFSLGQYRYDAGLGLFVLENILLVRVRNTFLLPKHFTSTHALVCLYSTVQSILIHVGYDALQSILFEHKILKISQLVS